MMTFIKRVFLSVSRNSGRSILLFSIVFLLTTFLSISTTLRNAIYQTEENLMARLPAVATIEWEYRAAGYYNEVTEELTLEFLSTDTIEAVAALPYVRSFDVGSHIRLTSYELEWVFLPIDNELLPAGMSEEHVRYGYMDVLGGGRRQGRLNEQFPIAGVNHPILIDAESGLISLTTGRFMTEIELDQAAPVALISESFAQLNNLEVGSAFLLEQIVHDSQGIIAYLDANVENWGWSDLPPALHVNAADFTLFHQVVELEVVGIFSIDAPFLFPDDYTRTRETAWQHSRLHNQIYIPHRLVENIARAALPYQGPVTSSEVPEPTEEEPMILVALFLLENPRYFNVFREATAQILPAGWDVYNLSPVADPMVSSMDVMLDIANFIFLGAIVTSMVVLSLLIGLYLKDRNYEVGIYLALGDRKRQIVGQFLSEIFVISFTAIVLALFMGHFLSSHVSRSMVEQHVMNQDRETSFHSVSMQLHDQLQPFNEGPLSVEEMMATYDASLNGETILFFIVSSASVILVSTIVPMYYVTKIDPKKLLM